MRQAQCRTRRRRLHRTSTISRVGAAEKAADPSSLPDFPRPAPPDLEPIATDFPSDGSTSRNNCPLSSFRPRADIRSAWRRARISQPTASHAPPLVCVDHRPGTRVYPATHFRFLPDAAQTGSSLYGDYRWGRPRLAHLRQLRTMRTEIEPSILSRLFRRRLCVASSPVGQQLLFLPFPFYVSHQGSTDLCTAIQASPVSAGMRMYAARTSQRRDATRQHSWHQYPEGYAGSSSSKLMVASSRSPCVPLPPHGGDAADRGPRSIPNSPDEPAQEGCKGRPRTAEGRQDHRGQRRTELPQAKKGRAASSDGRPTEWRHGSPVRAPDLSTDSQGAAHGELQYFGLMVKARGLRRYS